ncbi:MAG: hypothetical protein HRT56_05360, partial [Coraliomargarita sp.]|nr:hypothetical protein [Coraliomargarita sp.]
MGTVFGNEDSANQAATFEPNSEFFQVISGQLNTLNPLTGAYTEIGNQIDSYNAAGFNVLDNYVYAWGRGPGFKDQLIRIHADNTFEIIGAPTPIGEVAPSFGNYAGDMDYEGNLWIRGDKFQSAALMKINVTANTYEMVSFDGPNPGAVADLVYQTIDGSGYFYGCVHQDLYIWDVDAGVTTKVNVRNLPEGRRVYGAAYTDKNNSLFVSDNKGGVYQIINYKTDSPRAVYLMGSATTSSNDGFSNPLYDSPIIVPE